MIINFEIIIFFITGSWLTLTCFILNTNNTISAIIFKIIPFTLGMLTLFSAANLAGLFG